MFNRRRLSLAVTVVGCLLVVSTAASADPLDTFTATSLPTHVQPSMSVSYTIKLTNDLLSPDRAQQAKIGIPSSFTVNGSSVQATTSAVAGSCGVATWVADGALIANGKINLKRPGGNATALCPGATLTVNFLAASGTAEGTYAWTSDLLRDVGDPFTLVGPQPSVVVDGTSPTTTITSKPSNPTNVASPSFAFTASESARFECKLDSAVFAPCTSPKGYPALANGSHTFQVKATDIADNTGPETTYTWTLDTVAPTNVITQKPSNPSSTSSATFAFTASQSGSSFSCRLDEGGFQPCSSPKTYSDLSDGPHIFSVKATDQAGNTGPDVPYGWTIETRAPTAALTLAPAGLSNSRLATFGFAADEPSTFECKQDDRGFEPCTSPASYVGLGDGAHVFSVRARDAVGNMSVPVSHAWTIDATAPETTLASAPKSAMTATSATFAFSASENGTFECRLDGAPFALCASPTSYSGLGQGDHRFEVRAIDAAGNADASPALHPWKIQAPVRKIATSALLAPRSGARVTKPPLLVWRGVPRAGYYNVQVFRGKQKVLSAWPTRARLRLRARWKFAGRVRRLTPGAYRWYVWPGYGVPSARNYGQLLGQSTFVVARSARR
jgi:hypothetical protein